MMGFRRIRGGHEMRYWTQARGEDWRSRVAWLGSATLVVVIALLGAWVARWLS